MVIGKSTLSGVVQVPSSKSFVHRALVMASIASTPSEIVCDSCEDVETTVACLNGLGAKISRTESGYFVEPISDLTRNPVLDCNESASSLRFLMPLAATLGIECSFTGRRRLPLRPIVGELKFLSEYGVSFTSDRMPFTQKGRLNGNVFYIRDVISSQIVSGLMMAVSFLDRVTEIRFERLPSFDYLLVTADVMRLFGVETELSQNGVIVYGKPFSGQKVYAEGDWTAASLWIGGAAACGTVSIAGLKADSAQGDRRILDVCRRANVDFSFENDVLTVKKSVIRPFCADVDRCPDLAPTYAVLAASAKGESRLQNVGRLRYKESDRVDGIQKLLASFGVRSHLSADDLLIEGGVFYESTFAFPCDHRLIMAGCVFALACEKESVFENVSGVKKSYPRFFDDLKKLGGNIRV